jgi:hypothetical protein
MNYNAIQQERVAAEKPVGLPAGGARITRMLTARLFHMRAAFCLFCSPHGNDKANSSVMDSSPFAG